MAEAGTAAPEAPVANSGSLFNAIRPFIPTYTHLIITALLPIVTGAHASLGRPANVLRPSKAPEKKTIKGGKGPITQLDFDEEDEEEELNAVETLTTKDAVLFPITAGLMLGGLYLIIKYLDDPAILNKIMTYYFTVMGTFAVGKFYSDSLGVLASLIFPRRWSERVGSVRRVYVAGHDHYKLVIPSGTKAAPEDLVRHNPLPRSFIPVPKALYAPIWSLRRSLLAKWAVVFKLGRGKGNSTRTTFWIGDLVGLISAIVTVGFYLISGKHWIGTNIMGVSFAYGAMQLISPATFSTATLLLSLLFFYDIYFVFYTPLMVTVATSLDVPIKLLFPRPLPAGSDKKYALAMLGLGDVVLPGIMIALSLRFDYWRWCEARRLESIKGLDEATAKSKALPKYIKPTGTWGERLWNCGMADLGGVFPKAYFYSSIVGYVIGMLATLVVMHVFNHAQPALLYLVPAVLGAVWGTAVVRGEVGLVWGYDEVVEVEEEVNKKEIEKEVKSKLGKAIGSKVNIKSLLVEKDVKVDTAADAGTTATVIEAEAVPVLAEKSSVPEPVVEEITETVADEVLESEKLEDEDIELVDEKGEAEYISVKIVKKPAPGAAVRR